MQTGQIILSRGLPKTGQTSEKYSGDDGDYEAGWWKGTDTPNLRTRFIAKPLGEDDDDVVIDLATGLMWAADDEKAGCDYPNLVSWYDAIDYANELTFAGCSDWRIPNIHELSSIIDFGCNNPAIDKTFFPNTLSLFYWSSTDALGVADNWWLVNFEAGKKDYKAHYGKYHIRCVRGGV